MQTKRQQNKKGTVAVGEIKGWLRLRWSYQGKAFTMALGLPDTSRNRDIAKFKATTIQGDIETNNFDPTLKT